MNDNDSDVLQIEMPTSEKRMVDIEVSNQDPSPDVIRNAN